MNKVMAGGLAVVAVLSAVLPSAGADGDSWRPPEKFHFLAQYPEANKATADRPAIQDLCPIISVRPKKTKKPGEPLHFPVENVVAPKKPDGTPKPFVLNCWARFSLMASAFMNETVDPRDHGLWLKFKAEHPECIGVKSGEWINDAKRHPRFTPGKGMPANRGANEIPAERWRELCEKYWREHPVPDPAAYATNHLRWVYNRACELSFNDPSSFIIGDGCWCGDHLTADWGCAQLWMETSRNYRFWQRQLMFTRGAAAQYNRPFHWYVASYYSGFASDSSRFKGDGNQSPATPHLGISRSAVKRVTYLTYLSGAASYQREAASTVYEYRGELSEEGRIYEDFWRFVKEHPDRGVPLRPVAIVVPFDRGFSRSGGIPFSLYPYRRTDFLLDALVGIILETRRNSMMEMQRNGVERVMANSKYGDVFDVIVPGLEHPETFRKALGNYRVVFIAGDFGWSQIYRDAFPNYRAAGQETKLSAEDRQAIEDFKASGGTVVDVNEFVGEWGSAEMSSTYEEPKLAAAVENAVLPTHPFRVTGDVQFGFNRTKDGWWIYLINNAGVKKFGDTPEEIAPGGSEVTIDLKGFKATEVRELITNQTIVQSDNQTISLTVPYGDVRVVRVR